MEEDPHEGRVGILGHLRRLPESLENLVNDNLDDNFKLEFRPEYRLKFRKQLENATVGANFSSNIKGIQLMAKPGVKAHRYAKCVKKVVVTPQAGGAVRVYSKMLPIAFMRFQFIAGYDLADNSFAIRYKLKTAIPEGLPLKNEVKHKFDRLSTDIGLRWDYQYFGPQMEGVFGNADEHSDYELDIGQYNVSVVRLQAAVRR
ncbi:hypothetical protein CYMTET_45540 [Cymbomonas tetramitiformis]|uniref:DUF7781 domain-containing protein n=1 Tax=Cymbomonas tetramitiformis TaxID=36881 RepID=A0AAE0EY79_9CHLO|nr:hypothetical protein CYMTET_45540 [Cymbomonas tetramitiformis]